MTKRRISHLLRQYLNLIPIGFFSSLVVTSGILMISASLISRPSPTKMSKLFYTTLRQGLKNNMIETFDDVVNLYKGSGADEADYRHNLSKHLRIFLVQLHNNNEEDIAGENIEGSSIKAWKEKLTKWIEENERKSPYADLPPTERSLLSELDRMIATKDVGSIKNRISELAGMIQARSEEQARTQEINKWTIPVSIIGTFFTIFFGIQSWRLKLKQRGRNRN